MNRYVPYMTYNIDRNYSLLITYYYLFYILAFFPVYLAAI